MRHQLSKPRTYEVRKVENYLWKMNKQLGSYLDAMDSSRLGTEKLLEKLDFAFKEVWCNHMTLPQFISS